MATYDLWVMMPIRTLAWVSGMANLRDFENSSPTLSRGEKASNATSGTPAN